MALSIGIANRGSNKRAHSPVKHYVQGGHTQALLASMGGQRPEVTYVRQGATIRSRTGTPTTPEGMALARALASVLHDAGVEEQTICSITHSDRSGYPICITTWPPSEEADRQMRSIIVKHLNDSPGEPIWATW